MVVEYVGFAVASHRAVAEPAKSLVPLRTVGRHSAIVAPDSPESIVIDLVDDRVGCLEMSRDGHPVVHHLPLEVAELRFVLQAFDLNITETMIDIFRMPDNRLAVLGDVGVEDLCGTEIGKVESAVRIEKFSEPHREGVTFIESPGLDLKTADHVLSHVQDVAVVCLRDGDRLDNVHHGDVRIRLENQSASRSVHQRRLGPSGIIVADFCPAGQFLTGIVSLAVKLVVGSDRPLACDLPALVTDNSRGAAIGVNNVQPVPKPRKPEAFHARFPHRCVTPAAKAHGKSVLPFLEGLSDIELIEIHPRPVLGHGRGKFLVTGDIFPIDPSVIDSEAADAEGSLLYFAVQSHFLAKVAGRKHGATLKNISLIGAADPFAVIFSGGNRERDGKCREYC